jgi:hypothetical protein
VEVVGFWRLAAVCRRNSSVRRDQFGDDRFGDAVSATLGSATDLLLAGSTHQCKCEWL